MPVCTGYTYKFIEGEETTLGELLARCSLAFRTDTRDETYEDSKNIPRKMLKNKSEYVKTYKQKLEKAEKEYAEFMKIPEKEKKLIFEKEIKKSLKICLSSIEKDTKENSRIEDMILKVKNWKLPKPEEHYVRFRDFVIGQLKHSISSSNFDRDTINRLESQTYKKWRKEKIDHYCNNIDFYSSEFKRHTKSVEEEKKWIENLFAGIPKE